MVKAVRANTDQDWVVLYVQRWLVAPLQRPDGALEARRWGTPQGSAVSPVLANLFLHYAFDAWMAREFPTIAFERYVNDAVVHCVSKKQALLLRDKIGARLASVGLTLHPEKPRSCTARTGGGPARTSRPRSRSWATRSGRERRGTNTGRCSFRFCPRSAKTQ